MSQYVTLLGAEEVSRAASQMQRAAADMSRAASYFESVFDAHHRFLDDFLIRLDGILTDRIGDLGTTLGPLT